VVVLEPDDVVLAEVVAPLDLDHDQVVSLEVRDPVRRADGYVERAAGLDLDGVTVDHAGSGAARDDPVLVALCVGLVRQTPPGPDDEALDLVARPLVEHVPRSPRALVMSSSGHPGLSVASDVSGA